MRSERSCGRFSPKSNETEARRVRAQRQMRIAATLNGVPLVLDLCGSQSEKFGVAHLPEAIVL